MKRNEFLTSASLSRGNFILPTSRHLIREKKSDTMKERNDAYKNLPAFEAFEFSSNDFRLLRELRSFVDSFLIFGNFSCAIRITLPYLETFTTGSGGRVFKFRLEQHSGSLNT